MVHSYLNFSTLSRKYVSSPGTSEKSKYSFPTFVLFHYVMLTRRSMSIGLSNSKTNPPLIEIFFGIP
jgi:hypothetical protein